MGKKKVNRFEKQFMDSNNKVQKKNYIEKLKENEKDTGKQIEQTMDAIDLVISNIKDKIMEVGDNQEKKFLKEYKERMLKAQKELHELEKLSNEDQIRKETEDKMFMLEKEKVEKQEQAIRISDKNKALKETVKFLEKLDDNIIDDLKFVDEQLLISAEQNRRLNAELNEIQQKIKETNPDFKLDTDDNLLSLLPPIQGKQQVDTYGNIQRQSHISIHKSLNKSKVGKNNFSYIKKQKGKNKFANTERYEKEVTRLQKEIKKQKIINEKLNQLNQDEIFQPIEIERIFMQCVENVQQKFEDEQRDTMSMTMNSQQRSQQSRMNESDMGSYKRQNKRPRKKFQKSKQQKYRLTDTEKRLIMEEFLTNNTIKDVIYQEFNKEIQKQQQIKKLV